MTILFFRDPVQGSSICTIHAVHRLKTCAINLIKSVCVSLEKLKQSAISVPVWTQTHTVTGL